MRVWQRAVPALVMSVLALAAGTNLARASAEVHKLNLVFSAIPSSVNGGDFNDYIDRINRNNLAPIGLEPLDQIGMGWLFDVELRYFLRPNIALAAGVGQLRATSQKEYLPSLSDDVVLTADILSAPIHVGADYYFAPYNQGDFQARGFVGGGLLSLTSTRARLDQAAVGPNVGAFNLQSSWTADSPGFYAEAGVHMFFALRYSVMLGGIYRSAEVRNTGAYFRGPQTGGQEVFLGTMPFSIDVGGLGARASIAVGF